MSDTDRKIGAIFVAHDPISIPQSPYNVGNTLRLTLHRGDEPTAADIEILEQHGPSTFSTVLSVSVPGHLIGSTKPSVRAILKIYDRRFAEQLRAEQKVGSWSPEKERNFASFVASGRAAEFMRFLDSDDDDEMPEEPWDDAQNEVLIQSWCKDLCDTERRAYECLARLQGNQIPKFFSMATIFRYWPEGGDQGGIGEGDDVFDIQGMLIEYIPGPILEKLADSVPSKHWQYCVDQAVEIIRTYAEYNILNQDVKTRNFIVSPSAIGWNGARVVMIDFGLCKFREPDQSDAEWGYAKCVEDEEGAVGLVMQSRLRGRGPEITYQPSGRWDEYKDGEPTAEEMEKMRKAGQVAAMQAAP
ncbi:hypothetical protein B0A55_08263 [Friedmanniomyces simplex]|uniref:Protein kinase domain-containing protein n=1 Tax=Friedmanniomyces simplex TaxID=329884 RepID=A0A4U0WU94_9PEZI|nr:hypothetical protein B0A55_08263 [Friedmanniomyces simplex]